MFVLLEYPKEAWARSGGPGSVLTYFSGTEMEMLPFSGMMRTWVHVSGLPLDFLGWCWHLLAHDTLLLELGFRGISSDMLGMFSCRCWVLSFHLAYVSLKFSFVKPSCWNEFVSSPNNVWWCITWYYWKPTFEPMCLKQMFFCPSIPVISVFLLERSVFRSQQCIPGVIWVVTPRYTGHGDPLGAGPTAGA